MEEIGHRTVKFEFSSIGDDRREFIAWLLGQCLEDGVEPSSVFEDAVQEYLAEQLSTPLQFAEHLNRAFADAYRMGADQVTRDIVSETISVGFDDLDARLARIGYTPKSLADLADARLPEMRRFLKGQLDPDRTDELSCERLGCPYDFQRQAAQLCGTGSDRCCTRTEKRWLHKDVLSLGWDACRCCLRA